MDGAPQRGENSQIRVRSRESVRFAGQSFDFCQHFARCSAGAEAARLPPLPAAVGTAR